MYILYITISIIYIFYLFIIHLNFMPIRSGAPFAPERVRDWLTLRSMWARGQLHGYEQL